ncbi:MAG: hypothetical protein IPL32_20465 [Chloracidobacterium sp.]|nr:hypothetical protein [Chloracidobacterium sp.]
MLGDLWRQLTTIAEVAGARLPVWTTHLGGVVGINNPATSAPWTYCDRQTTASCTARGVPTMYHPSHRTIANRVLNTQSQGPNLLATSGRATKPISIIRSA